MIEASENHQRSSNAADRRLLSVVLVGSVVLILISGVLLYSVRGTLGLLLDRSPPIAPRSPVLVPEDVEPPLVPPPSADLLSEQEIAERNERVRAGLESLIGAGIDELPDFARLSSGGDIERQLFAPRWRAWRRIWINRVAVVEDLLAPIEQCDRHHHLAQTCVELSGVTNELVSVAGSKEVEQAQHILEQCAIRMQASSSSAGEETDGLVSDDPEVGRAPEENTDDVGDQEGPVGDDRDN